MENIDYTVETEKSFTAAVDSVVRETEAVGFRVLHIHNVQETLSKKNFASEPLNIIEVCNAQNAFDAIQKNISLALFLPCKINVFVKNKKVYISALRPLTIKNIFPDLDTGNLFEQVEQKIEEIVDRAK